MQRERVPDKTIPDMLETTKKVLSLAEVYELVGNTFFPVTPENRNRSRCVDGRYEGEGSLRPLAKPGGDAGDFMVACAALRRSGLNVLDEHYPRIIEAVLKTVGGIENFHAHTDEHATHSEQLPDCIGCGHRKKAMIYPDQYGVTKGDMEYFEKFLVDHHVPLSVLHGEHSEGAVIVIADDRFSMRPQYQEGEGLLQAFIYQKNLDQERLKHLADNLLPFAQALKKGNLNLAELTQNAFQASELQLGTTLRHLAVGLPVYTASMNPDSSFNVTEMKSAS